MYGALLLWGSLLGLTFFFYITRPEWVVYCPDLGPDQGAVLVTGEHKILYYKGGSIPSHTSDWEWKSILGYEGIFDADILILNLEDVKEPLPLTLPVPVREIWVTGGRAQEKTPRLLQDLREQSGRFPNPVSAWGACPLSPMGAAGFCPRGIGASIFREEGEWRKRPFLRIPSGLLPVGRMERASGRRKWTGSRRRPWFMAEAVFPHLLRTWICLSSKIIRQPMCTGKACRPHPSGISGSWKIHHGYEEIK